MNQILTLICVAALLAPACTGTKMILQKDPLATEMVEQGKDLLRTKDYGKAATVFQDASNRPNNQQTTTALYFSGLSYFYKGESFPAEQAFKKLIREYPKSRYLPEAQYHHSILLLKKYDDRLKTQALNTLLTLAENAKDTGLKENALKAAQEFLFYTNKKISFLQGYLAQAPPSYKTTVLEAWVHHLVSSGKKGEVAGLYEQHLAAGGEASEYIASITEEQQAQAAAILDPDIIKIALVLPTYLDDYITYYGLDAIPPKSQDGLEFYEGFKQAVDDYSLNSNKKIFVEYYDSRRDTARLRSQLDGRIAARPDIVVGDVFTDASLAVSDWARKHQVPQMVPFSANPILMETDTTGLVFLARPSASTHGSRMGEYASTTLGLTNVVVWSDQRRITETLVSNFKTAFEALLGTVKVVYIDSVYEDRAQDDIIDYFKDHVTDWDSIDGVYIPISNEESAGLILSNLAIETKGEGIRALGTSAWESFKLISQYEKEKFGLTFTSAYDETNDPSAFRQYYSRFVKDYRLPPSRANVQGYGLGKYLLHLLDNYDPRTISLPDFIRNNEPYKALQTDFHFQQAQDNQAVNILEFSNGEIVKVK